MSCPNIAVVVLKLSKARTDELLGSDAVLEAIRQFLAEELRHRITLNKWTDDEAEWESTRATVLRLTEAGFRGYDITALEPKLNEFVDDLGLALRKQATVAAIRATGAVQSEGVSPEDATVRQFVLSL